MVFLSLLSLLPPPSLPPPPKPQGRGGGKGGKKKQQQHLPSSSSSSSSSSSAWGPAPFLASLAKVLPRVHGKVHVVLSLKGCLTSTSSTYASSSFAAATAQEWGTLGLKPEVAQALAAAEVDEQRGGGSGSGSASAVHQKQGGHSGAAAAAAGDGSHLLPRLTPQAASVRAGLVKGGGGGGGSSSSSSGSSSMGGGGMGGGGGSVVWWYVDGAHPPNELLHKITCGRVMGSGLRALAGHQFGADPGTGVGRDD